MIIYFINLFTILIYNFMYSFIFKSDKSKRILRNIIIIQLTLFIGLRGLSIGADTPFYIKSYESAKGVTLGTFLEISRFEVGYNVLEYLFSNLDINITIFFTFIAFISVYPIIKTIFDENEDPFLGVYIYISFGLYTFLFSGIRQGVAFGLTFFSYKYIKEKKVVKYLFTIFLASLFHKSAILFLPAYLIYRIKLTDLKKVLVLPLMITVFVLKRQIYTLFSKVLYDDYTIVESVSYNWMLMCNLFSMIFLIYYNKIRKIYGEKYNVINIVLVGGIMMLFAPILNNIMRIANYYYMFIVLAFPILFKYGFDKKQSVIFRHILIIIFAGIYYYLMSRPLLLIPYTFAI